MCRCKSSWSDRSHDANCVNQQGCEEISCSEDRARWCQVVESPCDPGAYEVNDGSQPWMTCGDDTEIQGKSCERYTRYSLI